MKTIHIFPDAPAPSPAPGSLILLHGGEYAPMRFGPEWSGTGESPTVIRAAEGESPVIRAAGGVGVRLTDLSRFVLDGLEIEGGTHGIRYEGTRNSGALPLSDVTIRNCAVHRIRGTHGICVYVRNPHAPLRNLTVAGCHVYDCRCGSSESVVVNGNIDGFLIEGNLIHDNNNIGIDMIGFEGTAKRGDGHPDTAEGESPYASDMARNGICRNNIVYNICTEGNMAYYRDGAFDRCADGIYVDGGRNIEIYGNTVRNCDIGIEVATEHSPDDDPLFRVTGVRVHHNVIADCRGFAGLCFGGYAPRLGFTEDCEFDHNTLIGNGVQIAVQRSRNNRIHDNVLAGGGTAVLYSGGFAPADPVNRFYDNVCAGTEDGEGWREEYGLFVGPHPFPFTDD